MIHDTLWKNSKNENVLINNDGQNKQNLYIYSLFGIMHSFPKPGAESC